MVAQVGAEPVVVTFDIDWAPDFAIDAAAAMLVKRGVRATWMVTHRSPAVDRLRARPDLFELGIHPNFREGSSHGVTVDEVLQHCMDLVPDAVSLRTHSLVQSTPLLARVVATTPIRVDASLLLPRVSGLRPFEQPFEGVLLRRVPFDWEDDVEMEFLTPRWSARAVLAEPGMRTFNFHPIHVYLNSCDMTAYRNVRASGTKLDLLDEDAARPHVHHGAGAKQMLQELIDNVDAAQTKLLRDLR